MQFINTAPFVNEGFSSTLPPVVVGTSSPIGAMVSSLLGAVMSDVDPLAEQGIAITAATGAAFGTWQYSTDRGESWLGLVSPTITSARLLRSTDRVRFLPSADAQPGTATMAFRGWDRTSGIAGGTADTSTSGGSSAFSVNIGSASVTTVAKNTAPTLSSYGAGGFLTVLEDTPSPFGTKIAGLVGSSMIDIDSGTTPGIALTGVTQASNGAWQYSLDDGTSWIPVGEVATSAALLLRSSDRLRFVSVQNFNGLASVIYRGWDQSASEVGIRVDLSLAGSVGGATPFSVETATQSLTITPVNDAPTFISDTASLRLRPLPINPTQTQWTSNGTKVGDLLGNSVSDVDRSAVRGIAIIGTGAGGTFWWNTGSGGWSSIAAGANYATLLRESDFLYFQPQSSFSGTNSVTFRLWDQTSGSVGYNGANLSTTGSFGGKTAFSSEILTASVFVGAVATNPTASFGAVQRGVDGQSVGSVPIAFSGSVEGVDVGDFVLTRDGTPLSLTAATLAGSGASFLLGNLSAATLSPGSYALTLAASQSGITDTVGNRFLSGLTTTFIVAPPTLPGIPIGIIGTAGNGEVGLSWTTPLSNGGAQIIDYVIQFSSDLGLTWTTFNDGFGTTTSTTVAGLNGEIAYLFRVAAVNSVGAGAYSSSSAPVTPTQVVIHEPGLGQTAVDAIARAGATQIIKRGLGTLILDKANSHSGGNIVEAGEVVVKNVTALGTGTLDVRAGAKVTLDVAGGSVAVGNIMLAEGSQLDFGFGQITVPSGGYSLAAIKGLLSQGHASSWAGLVGFTTRAAGSLEGGSVGYVVNRDGSISVGFAASGDTNLDGQVDILDISNFVSSNKYNSTMVASWSEGDFNYDGTIDILDIAAMLSPSLYDAGSYMPAPAAQAESSSASLSAIDSAFLAWAAGTTTEGAAPPRKVRFVKA